MTPVAQNDLRELVELGRFLDARVELDEVEKVVRLASAPLLWSEPARALVIVSRLPRATRPIVARGSKHERVYRRWTAGREPTRERTVELVLPASWSSSAARTIGYRSDKFHAEGSTVDYQHEFGRSVVAHLSECRSWLVIRGGHLRVTARGIEG